VLTVTLFLQLMEIAGASLVLLTKKQAPVPVQQIEQAAPVV
jgi:hypothetical protein